MRSIALAGRVARGFAGTGTVSAAGMRQPETARVRARSRQAVGSIPVEVIAPFLRQPRDRGFQGTPRGSAGIKRARRLAPTRRSVYPCREPASRPPLSNGLETLRAALAGRYEIQRELGRGGMATVYLAHDANHDRPVALKVVLPELAAPIGNDRFQREIKLAARLQHPHILSVYDSGEAAGQLWFTMPFVEGESLRDRLVRGTQLPVEDAVRIVREAALALDYAHRPGVRD